VDPDWLMPWYWNLDNRTGLAMHAYGLPGHPASHGCIRLLENDAIWLHDWAEAGGDAPGAGTTPRRRAAAGQPVARMGGRRPVLPPAG
jgi:hypothetical protein